MGFGIKASGVGLGYLDYLTIATRDILLADEIINENWTKGRINRRSKLSRVGMAPPSIGVAPLSQQGIPEVGKTGLTIRVGILLHFESPHLIITDDEEPSIVAISDRCKRVLLEKPNYLLQVEAFGFEPLVDRHLGFDTEDISEESPADGPIQQTLLLVSAYGAPTDAWSDIPNRLSLGA